jgi:hypothetical protein
MKCPVCNEDWESDGPFESWDECFNCEWKKNNAIWYGKVRKQLEDAKKILIEIAFSRSHWDEDINILKAREFLEKEFNITGRDNG